MRDLLLSIFFCMGLFLTFSNLLYASLHKPMVVTVSRDWGLDGEIKVCPPDVIYDDVEYAVSEWNKAIGYFGWRYMWFDVLGTRFILKPNTSEDCDVVFRFVELRELRPCVDLGDSLVVAITVFNDTLNGKGATIALWKGLVGQDIKHVLRRVLIHELSNVIGLVGNSYNSVESASSYYGSLKVRSIDVYALHVRSTLDGISIYKYDREVPQSIPYLTVEESLAYDLQLILVSAFISLLLYRFLRVVK